MVIATLILSCAGLLAVLLFLGRYNEVLIDVDWEELITPEGRQAYEDLRHRFAEHRAVVNLTYDRALEAGRKAEDAALLLAAGYSFLEQVAGERRKLYESMARYSRMVDAIAPLPPVNPGQFNLRELATLAGVGAVFHHFLVTVPERLRLRLLILRAGAGVVLRSMRRANRGGQTDWRMVDAARDDWNTLSVETLASFRALVTGVVIPSKDAATAAAGR